MLKYMFETSGAKGTNLVSRYHLNEGCLINWMKEIKAKYRQENPYHNWAHALEVTQMARYAVSSAGGSDYLNNQDIFALLCSCIAHDVAHHGYNTQFLKRADTDLALMYNDTSPMENMHACVFFQTMQQSGCQFFAPEEQRKWKNFRRKVIATILATDIAKHFEFLKRLNLRVGKLEFNPFVEDRNTLADKNNVSKEDRMLLLEAFMHTVDLTHNFKPFNVHKIGLAALENEWFNQGDEELRLGLPITANYDRRSDSAAGCQTFFLGSMVKPLLVAFHCFTRQDFAEDILLNLDTNIQCWEKAIDQHGKGKKVAELVKILPANWGEENKEELIQGGWRQELPWVKAWRDAAVKKAQEHGEEQASAKKEKEKAQA